MAAESYVPGSHWKAAGSQDDLAGRQLCEGASELDLNRAHGVVLDIKGKLHYRAALFLEMSRCLFVSRETVVMQRTCLMILIVCNCSEYCTGIFVWRSSEQLS